MSSYSIKDLEHMSGIKAHTLRVWEQRYKILEPKRTETNIRYYNDDDLKRVLNIAMLNEHGLKISKIAQFSPNELSEKVLSLSNNQTQASDQIQGLTLAMIDLDEERFEKIISSAIMHRGFEETMIRVIHPFLAKIGVLWQTGAINPAQEHFISYLIRHKLIVAIDGQSYKRNPHADQFILFLPEGELHEMSLLFADYLLRARHLNTVYLGQSLPMHDLKAVYDIHKAKYMLTIITNTPGPKDVQNYVNKLAKTFPEAHILLSGYQAVTQDLEVPANCELVYKVQDLITFADKLEA